MRETKDTHDSVTSPWLATVFAPHRALVAVDRRRNSVLLAYLTVGLILLFGILNLTSKIMIPDYRTPTQSLAGYGILITAFVLNRAGKYRAAAVTVLATFPLIQFSEVITGASTDVQMALTFLILGIVFAGILLETGGTIAYSALIVIGIVLMPVLAPAVIVDPDAIIGPAAICVIGSALVILSKLQRDKIEQARRSELEGYRDHLEDLVEERTRSLEQTHEELLASEKMAVLGRLTATISHELRNPLSTIRNSSYSLKELVESSSSDLKSVYARIERSIIRCDNIINDLLYFTRINNIASNRFELDPWLEKLVGTLVDENPVPDLELVLELKSGAEISADEDALKRALTNIVTNSLQAVTSLDAGNPRIEISTTVEDQVVKIQVCDSGAGMDEEVLSRACEPLFSTKPFGVGLGLPIAKTVMTDHAGALEIQSSPTRGTTVTAWLPYRVE